MTTPTNDTWRNGYRCDSQGRPLYRIRVEDEARDANETEVAGGEPRDGDGYRQIAFTNPPATLATYTADQLAQDNAIAAAVAVNVTQTADILLRAAKLDLPFVSINQFAGTFDAKLTLALAALGASGGTIVIPAGSYTSSSPPSFAQLNNITIRGAGGVTAGATPATQISYTGTGTRWLDCRSSFGFKLKDLMVTYNQAGFSGTLIDLSHVISQDSAYGVLENVYLGGAGVRGAGRLVDLDKAITMTFRDCTFGAALDAVRGQAAAGSYSNVISFYNCTFKDQVNQSCRNAAETWLFSACTFERLVTSGGVAAGAGALTYDASVVAEGVVFDACWFGDATTAGDWINFNGQGLTVRGCHIGGGSVGIRCDQNNTIGVTILGNVFDGQNAGGMVISGTGHRGYLIDANVMIAGAAALIAFGGTFPTGSRIQDPSNAGGAFAYDSTLQRIAASVSDGSYPFTPVDGMTAIDTTNSQLALRWGGTWKNIPTTLRTTLSWDPASVANAASVSTTATVTGAALGDYAMASAQASVLTTGTALYAHVTAANTVTLTLMNLSGGAVDNNFGTITVSVVKKI